MPNHSNQGTIDRKKGQRTNQTSQSSRPDLPGFIELVAIAKGLNLALGLTESSYNPHALQLLTRQIDQLICQLTNLGVERIHQT